MRTFISLYRSLQKNQRIARLDKFVIVLFKQLFFKTSVKGRIHIQVHILLASVKYLNQNMSAVRCPTDICQIPLLVKVGHIQKNRFAGGRIVNTK